MSIKCERSQRGRPASRGQKRTNAKSIYGMGKKSLEELRVEMRDSPIVSLDGVENVWCTTALLNKKLALINIIKTKTSFDSK